MNRVTPPAPNVRYAPAVADDDPPMLTVEEWLARLPSAEECARAEVEPYAHMSVAERIAVFDGLQRDADLVLAGRPPVRDPADDDWWLRWRDPSVGRPRRPA